LRMTTTWKSIGIISLIIIFGFVLRIPYFFHVMQDIDEGCHAAIAAMMMHGGSLPACAADNKPPGISYIYLTAFSLFGRYNMTAIHMVTFVWTLATAIVLSVLAKKLGGKKAALFAMLFYLAFTTALYPKMIAANTEIFMALPYSLAVLLLWYACDREKWSLFLLSGFVSGIAPLIKQVGVVELAAVSAYLLFAIPILLGKKKIYSSIAACAQFVIGYILPIATVAFLFYRKGILAEQIFWSITYPRRYVSQGAANLSFMSQIIEEFVPFVLSTVILWVLSFIWIKRAAVDLREKKISFSTQFSLFLVIWLITSWAATFIGKRMYGHYFIQILPPLSLMAALIAAKYFERTDARGRYWKAAIMALTAVPALVFLGMAISFEATTDTWGEVKPDFRPAAEYISTHTNPEDRIFVWGWFTPVYVYSERTPSTRFVNTTMQTGSKKGSDSNEADRADVAWASLPESWPMLMSDLNRHLSELIVDTSPGNYHDFGRYPIKNYPLLNSFVQKNCRLETSVAGMDIYRCGHGSGNAYAKRE
jgi:4-amino-4-deoxy-L-arabinose transferase-like glycosyltransferase